MFLSFFVYTFLMITMYAFFLKASKRKCFKKNNYFYYKDILLPIILFAIIMGMRYDVGTDYENYFEAYTGLSSENDRFEIGYRAFVWLCHSLNLHYVFYFSLAAFIPVFFYYKAFERQPYLFPLLTLFLFFNNEYWNWMNVMRCSIAICLFVYSVNFIANYDWKRYYLFAILALLFHKSAILLFVIYPFFAIDVDYLKKRYIQLGLFVLMFVLAAGFEALFLKYAGVISWYQSALGGEDMSYSSYSLDNLYEELGNAARSNTGMVKYFKYIVWLLIIWFSPKLKSFYAGKKFEIIYILFFAGSFIHGVLPEGAISLARPFRFFAIFQTIMYAYFLFFLKSQKNSTICKLLYLGILAVFFVIFYVNMALSGSEAHLWYQFFWSNPRG